MKKQKIAISEPNLPICENVTISTATLRHAAVECGTLNYDRRATENEVCQHAERTGRAKFELELIERQIEALKEQQLEKQQDLNFLAAQIKQDEDGEVFIYMPESTDGIWVNRASYDELIAPIDGDLKVVARREPTTPTLFKSDDSILHTRIERFVSEFSFLFDDYVDSVFTKKRKSAVIPESDQKNGTEG